MGIRQIGVAALLVSAMCVWSGCGGSDSPTAPSDPGGGGGGGGGGGTGTGVSQATITITASGVSPSSVTISSGNRVTFVNNDTASLPHDMASDPHPIHSDCPGLNIGSLASGQSRDSAVLTTRRTCGFHDHNNPDTASLKGSVTVQ